MAYTINESAVTRSNRAFRILFALLLPVTALYYSIRHFKNKDAKWFFIFGLSFLGYTIGLEGDLEAYNDMFHNIKRVSWSDLYEDIITFKQGDFYINVVAKVTNIFSEDSNLFFAVLITVYAYFYASIIKCFVNFLPKKMPYWVIAIFSAFALYFTIRAFISVRFYTASLVFLYGVLQYLQTNKKKYLLYCAFTPIIHLAFAVALPFLGLYYIIQTKFKVAFIIMIASFLIGQSTILQFLESTSKEYSNTAVNDKVDAYASERGMKSLNKRYSSANYNVKVKMLNGVKTFSDYFISVGLLLAMYYNRSILKDQHVKRLFSFIFICWSLANIMMNVSNGGRYTILYLFTGMGFFLLLYVKNYINRPLLNYLKLGVPIVILYGLMAIYAANPLFTINFFVSNYIIEWFM